jgi:hypothetical protein
LQRSQPYENVMGCLPRQLPGSAVTAEPTSVVPRTVGMLVSTGGPTTVAVGFEAAVLEPSLLVAVIRARSRSPTSAAATTYFELVAPAMMVQSLPSGSPPPGPHRTQRKAYEIDPPPVHEPRDAVSVLPCSGLPVIEGSPVFCGGAAAAGVPAAGRTSAARPIALASVTSAVPECRRRRSSVFATIVSLLRSLRVAYEV